MRKASLEARRQKVERELERVSRLIAAEQQRVTKIEARLMVLGKNQRKAA